jgi:DNA mismatch endonuclease (patch repair protein)
LETGGWRVAVIWECSLRGPGHRARIDLTVANLAAWLRSRETRLEISGDDMSATTKVHDQPSATD